MCVLKRKGELSHEKFDYLLKGPQVGTWGKNVDFYLRTVLHYKRSCTFFSSVFASSQVTGPPNPAPDWLSNSCWQSVLALKAISDYHALPEDLVSSSKRWKEWLEMPRPEAEPLPGEQALSGAFGCRFAMTALICPLPSC